MAGKTLFDTRIPSLQAKLGRLKLRMQGRILRGAMKDYMQPVLEEARKIMEAEASDTGDTAKRLRIKTGKPHRDGSRTVRVGIFGPASHGRGKRNRREVATGRIIEFGTTEQPAQLILRRALTARKPEALGTLTQRLRAGVLAAVV